MAFYKIYRKIWRRLKETWAKKKSLSADYNLNLKQTKIVV